MSVVARTHGTHNCPIWQRHRARPATTGKPRRWVHLPDHDSEARTFTQFVDPEGHQGDVRDVPVRRGIVQLRPRPRAVLDAGA